MTRDERHRQLSAMSPTELESLYRKLYGVEPGVMIEPGTLLISDILAKEFPQSSGS